MDNKMIWKELNFLHNLTGQVILKLHQARNKVVVMVATVIAATALIIER